MLKIVGIMHLLALHCVAAGPQLTDATNADFIQCGPIHLNESTSSSVFTETAMRSEIECTTKCIERSCAVISLNDISGLCQLIVLNDESTATGPPGTHVVRVVGAEAGDRVWKVADFEQQLLEKAVILITIMFNNSGTGSSGSIQSTTLTQSGCYRIEATGARGGSRHPSISPVYTGGRGARMAGNFSLTSGTGLTIVVGQRGGDASQAMPNAASGGGGGTFVYTSANNVLLLAAGGGGGGSSGGTGISGQNGTSGTDSLPAGQTYSGYGGSNGQPGFSNTAIASYHGGSGAGWLGKANMTRKATQHGDRGGSRADGWIGGLAGTSNPGAVGGFGGGGGGAQSNGASGGGGGFSGGGAGLVHSFSGGGGGSFCGGSGCTGTAGGNTDSDQGSVVMVMVGAGCS